MQQSRPPELYDIYGVEYNPWFLQGWVIYSVIGCIVLFVVYTVYRLHSARRKIDISYTEQTINALDELKKSDWSNHKNFYIKLTQILKWYLQKRYNKDFMATTDSECLHILKSDQFIPEWIADRFEKLTDGVMFVKFANAQAAHERMKKDLESVLILTQKS